MLDGLEKKAWKDEETLDSQVAGFKVEENDEIVSPGNIRHAIAHARLHTRLALPRRAFYHAQFHILNYYSFYLLFLLISCLFSLK